MQYVQQVVLLKFRSTIMKKNLPGILTGAIVMLIGIIATCITRGGAIVEEPAASAKWLYSCSLILVIIGTIILVSAVLPEKKKTDTRTLTIAALMAALCYIGFALFKIDIPVGTEKTAFHFGNVFCVLAALLLGGLWGGLSGAVGMTIGDLLTGYITSAPKTFFLKLCIGLITGLVAHKVLKIEKESKPLAITWKTAVAAICGMAFNVVADPIVGYFYKTYLFGIPQDMAKALAKIGAVTTFVNAVVAVIAATLFYAALRPALRKAGLFK